MNSRKVKVGACILAGDMNTLVPFYRDILGLKTRWDGGNFASFSMKDGDLAFFMYARKEFVKSIGEAYQPPKGINQSFEVALWLPTYADVDAEYKRLSALGGVRFPTGAPITYDFGIRNFYVADPEGNLLEIGSTGREQSSMSE